MKEKEGNQSRQSQIRNWWRWSGKSAEVRWRRVKKIRKVTKNLRKIRFQIGREGFKNIRKK